MSALEEKLKELREEYAKTKHNKATNKHLGILRRKMANIKKEMTKKSGGRGVGFAVKKTGDATVVLVGFPNAGKSSLLSAITNAESEVAAYAFTTLDVIPGTISYGGAKIQLLDVPGLIEGASEGKGGGAKVASVIRVADMLLIMLDVNKPEGLFSLLDELYGLGIRANADRPGIRIEKKATGGVEIDAMGHKIPQRKEILEALGASSIYNCRIIFQKDSSIEDLSDFLDPSVVYMKALIILNKIDSVPRPFWEGIKKEVEASTGIRTIPISASNKTNTDALKYEIFAELGLLRIYLKPKDAEPDMEKPIIVKSGSSVLDVAKALHSKTAKSLKYAYINGKSAKFTNQRFGKEHIVEDGDILTLVYDKS